MNHQNDPMPGLTRRVTRIGVAVIVGFWTAYFILQTLVRVVILRWSGQVDPETVATEANMLLPRAISVAAAAAICIVIMAIHNRPRKVGIGARLSLTAVTGILGCAAHSFMGWIVFYHHDWHDGTGPFSVADYMPAACQFASERRVGVEPPQWQARSPTSRPSSAAARRRNNSSRPPALNRGWRNAIAKGPSAWPARGTR